MSDPKDVTNSTTSLTWIADELHKMPMGTLYPELTDEDKEQI